MNLAGQLRVGRHLGIIPRPIYNTKQGPYMNESDFKEHFCYLIVPRYELLLRHAPLPRALKLVRCTHEASVSSMDFKDLKYILYSTI